MPENVKICTRCIMDSSVPFIQFDEAGECNYCKIQDDLEKQYPLGSEGINRLQNIINKIKHDGKKKKYDCIIGVSGGTDSTYTLLLAVKMGLRPLVVHYDNGWDTETGIHNIESSIRGLNVDLYTFVENWEEFKDLQKSFFKASTPDIEVVTDIRIRYILHQSAVNEKVKYIIDGTSFRTEGKIPPPWSYGDGKYIKSVQKQFGTRKLKTVKMFNPLNTFYFKVIKGITTVHILNYVEYDKEKAKQVLEKELNWRDYGGHHYESTITRFCYSSLLPNKFKIDKRKTHFSARIRSRIMNREEALLRIKERPIPEQKEKDDAVYIMNKMGFSKEEFDAILARSPKSFMDYPNNFKTIYIFRKPITFIYRMLKGNVPYTLTLMEHMKN